MDERRTDTTTNTQYLCCLPIVRITRKKSGTLRIKGNYMLSTSHTMLDGWVDSTQHCMFH